MVSRLDLIIFGASGFTGKHTIPYVYKLAKVSERALTWGVAGRSEQKLKCILEETAKQLDTNFDNIPIITADVEDEKSLKKMAERAKIVINCCGPYRFCGEAVVKACINAGTHQVDISAEPQYMESIQVKYHKAAEEKGVYVISACGFDSIPTDLGVLFLEENFEGTLNSVEMYLDNVKDSLPSAPVINYCTWESLIISLSHSNELVSLRRQLYPQRIPTFQPKLKSRSPIHKQETFGGWCVPFITETDRSAVERTQLFLYEHEKKRPIQFNAYLVVGSLLKAIFLAIVGGIIFVLFIKFECWKNLLLKYPKLFSLGYFTNEMPSEEMLKSTFFNFYLYGKGWKRKVATGENYELNSPTDTTVIARVKGKDGYAITCITVTLAAIMVITETEKLPSKGGVYPPGAAFAKTSLIEQLNKNGLTFEIVSN